MNMKVPLKYYLNLAKGDIVEALFHAIQHEDWEAFSFLLPLQGDINARDECQDWTILMRAVDVESLDMVKTLIEAGADVNLRGCFEPDECPLTLAAYACQDSLNREHDYARNKKIFDYLYPLTSPELREIADKILHS